MASSIAPVYKQLNMRQIKKYLVLLFALAGPVCATAQMQKINSFGLSYQGLEARQIFNIPNRCDTSLSADYRAALQPGSTFWDSCQNARWIFYNNSWHVDSSGAGIDSLYARADSAFYRKSGTEHFAFLLGSGTAGGNSFSMRTVVSANFSTGINCPLPSLNNDSLQIFWNDLGRYLDEGSEWQNLSGGGFSILVPGFDASAHGYTLTVYANNIAAPPGPQHITSSVFTTTIDCPIPAFNGMALQIFWNDAGRYLVLGTEFTPIPAGGFTITIPGFNALTTNYSFYVYAQ